MAKAGAGSENPGNMAMRVALALPSILRERYLSAGWSGTKYTVPPAEMICRLPIFTIRSSPAPKLMSITSFCSPSGMEMVSSV